MYVGLLLVDGTVVYADRAALEALGLTLDAVLGKQVLETSWCTDLTSRQKLRDALRHAVYGHPCRFDMHLRLVNGDALALDFSLHPVADASGNVAYLVASVRPPPSRSAFPLSSQASK